MNTRASEALLRKFHLWSTLPEHLWQTLAQAMRWHSFAAGENIFPTPQTDDCLCVVCSGQARVYAKANHSSHAALLRTMEQGSVFGVHCIFNSDMPPQSVIIAHKDCSVLFIPSDVWERILTEHPKTMATYLQFLTKRIEFLNQKIQYLTAGCAERRLALYLTSHIPQDDRAVRLDISAVSLADLLDLGRASLYRAMDKLTADGFLERNGHEYILHRRDEMLAHYS